MREWLIFRALIIELLMYRSGGEVEANENRGRVADGEEEGIRMRNQYLSLVPNPFGEMSKRA